MVPLALRLLLVIAPPPPPPSTTNIDTSSEVLHSNRNIGKMATPAFLAERASGKSSITPKVFNTSTHKWEDVSRLSVQQQHDEASPLALRRLTMVSYNVWFAEHMQEQRARALFALLESLMPDVICLQVPVLNHQGGCTTSTKVFRK